MRECYILHEKFAFSFPIFLALVKWSSSMIKHLFSMPLYEITLFQTPRSDSNWKVMIVKKIKKLTCTTNNFYKIHPRRPYKFFLLIGIKNKISNLGRKTGVSSLLEFIRRSENSFREKFAGKTFRAKKNSSSNPRRFRGDDEKTRWRAVSGCNSPPEFPARPPCACDRDNADSASSTRVYLRSYTARISTTELELSFPLLSPLLLTRVKFPAHFRFLKSIRASSVDLISQDPSKSLTGFDRNEEADQTVIPRTLTMFNGRRDSIKLARCCTSGRSSWLRYRFVRCIPGRITRVVAAAAAFGLH